MSWLRQVFLTLKLANPRLPNVLSDYRIQYRYKYRQTDSLYQVCFEISTTRVGEKMVKNWGKGLFFPTNPLVLTHGYAVNNHKALEFFSV